MGTHSIVKFIEKDGNGNLIPLVSVFHAFDGYIVDGVGHKLAKWLFEKVLINGIGTDQTGEKYCNGVGCLAAKYIRDCKTSVGKVYICPLDIGTAYVDYIYQVVITDECSFFDAGIPLDDITEIIVTNYDIEEPIFVGKPSELLKFDEGKEDEILYS